MRPANEASERRRARPKGAALAVLLRGALDQAQDGDADATLRQAAEEIRQLARRTAMEFVDGVGRIVLQRFYGGDAERWRSHARGKVTLRELARRLDGCGLGATSLYRAVATHVYLEEHPEVRRLERITPTHMRYVLPLPESRQRDLLLRVDADGWSVNDLRREVATLESRPRRAAGTAPTLAREMAQFRASAERALRERADVTLADDELAAVYADLMSLRELLERLQQQLSPRRRLQFGGLPRSR